VLDSQNNSVSSIQSSTDTPFIPIYTNQPV